MLPREVVRAPLRAKLTIPQAPSMSTAAYGHAYDPADDGSDIVYDSSAALERRALGDRKQVMKILPMMHKGVVLLHEDGATIEMAPMQIWRQKDGTTVLRLGRNAFYFNEDGSFDGSEHAMDPAKATLIDDALKLARENRGLAPDTAYHVPGTPQYLDETRAWPTARRQTGGKIYTRTPGDGTH
jgi:hypothetical protein